MERSAGIALRWAGRLFILLAIFILVCSLFLPAAVQPLSEFVCPQNMELDNSRYPGANKPDNAKLELVCVGGNTSVSAAKKVLLTVVGFITLGLISLYFSQRLTFQRTRIPTVIR